MSAGVEGLRCQLGFLALRLHSKSLRSFCNARSGVSSFVVSSIASTRQSRSIQYQGSHTDSCASAEPIVDIVAPRQVEGVMEQVGPYILAGIVARVDLSYRVDLGISAESGMSRADMHTYTRRSSAALVRISSLLWPSAFIPGN
jgi:hypothetical protein